MNQPIVDTRWTVINGHRMPAQRIKDLEENLRRAKFGRTPDAGRLANAYDDLAVWYEVSAEQGDSVGTMAEKGALYRNLAEKYLRIYRGERG